MISRMNQLSVGYREYVAEDVRLATDCFSERLILKSGGDWTEVYRGRINRSMDAVKVSMPVNIDSNISSIVFPIPPPSLHTQTKHLPPLREIQRKAKRDKSNGGILNSHKSRLPIS